MRNLPKPISDRSMGWGPFAENDFSYAYHFKRSLGFEIASAKDKQCQHCKINFKPIQHDEKYCSSRCPERKERLNLYE